MEDCARRWSNPWTVLRLGGGGLCCDCNAEGEACSASGEGGTRGSGVWQRRVAAARGSVKAQKWHKCGAIDSLLLLYVIFT